MARRRAAATTLAVLGLVTACDGTNVAPPDDTILDPPEMWTPYVDEVEIRAINEAFSGSAEAPWGFEHDGIDFMISSGAPVAFQAVVDGEVTEVASWQNGVNWQVTVQIRYDARYTADYGFESFSDLASDGEAQLSSVAVGKGDHVDRGEAIGNLLYVTDGTHVHFGLREDDVAICPEPFFTEEALASILAVMHRQQPTWELCYL